MINLGQKFPEFSKQATVSTAPGKEFKTVTSNDHVSKKRWMVMFWYPKDFTFVCPTEIIDFNDKFKEFDSRNCDVIGASTDTEFSHLGWMTSHPGLRELQFPLLADTSKSLGEDLGILEDGEKIAYRATFIVDPNGIVKWVCANDLSVGRNVDEVVRVLDALQSGKLTPCGWKKGEKTLN
ncbi:MAG TPA: peroxiredoxin [Ignavibacteria bacterium]|nr:peroxiredoxin [Ignavibacteria bacterium]